MTFDDLSFCCFCFFCLTPKKCLDAKLFLLDLEKGLVPGPSSPDDVEDQSFASEWDEDFKSGKGIMGKV